MLYTQEAAGSSPALPTTFQLLRPFRIREGRVVLSQCAPWRTNPQCLYNQPNSPSISQIGDS